MKTPLLVISMGLLAVPSPGQQKAAKVGAEAVYQEVCVTCHGNDGRGQTDMGKSLGAADLTSDVVQKKDDAQLVKSVKNGQGKMPGVGDKYSDEEIRAVIKHIRQFPRK